MQRTHPDINLSTSLLGDWRSQNEQMMWTKIQEVSSAIMFPVVKEKKGLSWTKLHQMKPHLSFEIQAQTGS